MADLLLDRLQSALGTAYTVERELGGGGMSHVFVAHDTALGRRIVVKVLPPDAGAGVSAERFRREITVAAQLQHPLIVPVLSAGAASEEGRREPLLYFTMPLVEGESLRSRLDRQGQLSVGESVRVLRDVADALAHAHARGVVHRDIKPENVLLSGSHALVADFGVAKALAAAGDGTLTGVGMALGTPRYMAPEQALADPQVDHRADLYALGVVAYEMLAGKPPFDAGTAQQLAAAHVTQAPAPVTAHRPATPPALAELVHRLLEKHPPDRPESADAVLRALELVPTSGVESAQAIPAARAARGRTGARRPPVQRLLIGGALGALLLAAGVTAARLRDSAAAVTRERGAIAVLPFANMDGSHENQYFSDGITEDVLTALSGIENLRVISRTSIMAYKGTKKPLRQIAQELGVATVVEGSVRRAGNRVLISAKLVDARTDAPLWVRRYDRQLSDIFAIQAEIAHEIADALEAKLLPAADARLRRAPTHNLEAYDRYLRGRVLYYRYTAAANDTAVEHFRAAVALDPSFALGYAGLSDAYAQRAFRTFTRSATDSAIGAARRALEIDPELAEAHKALGLIHLVNGKLRESVAANRRALASNPNYTTALGNLGGALTELGRLDEAMVWLERQRALIPSEAENVRIWAGLGLTHYLLGDYAQARRYLELGRRDVLARLALVRLHLVHGYADSAVAVARQGAADAPEFAGAWTALGRAAMAAGDSARAREHLERALSLARSPHSDIYTSTTPEVLLAHLHAAAGNSSAARRYLARVDSVARARIADGVDDPTVRYVLAQARAVEGDSAGALRHLEHAIQGGWVDHRGARHDPLLAGLRGSPHFERLMDGVEARVGEMRERVRRHAAGAD